MLWNASSEVKAKLTTSFAGRRLRMVSAFPGSFKIASSRSSFGFAMGVEFLGPAGLNVRVAAGSIGVAHHEGSCVDCWIWYSD